MRYLQRLSEPENIKEKKAKWLQAFLKSNKESPDSSKYAHPKVREQLRTMSHNKCFYCETLLKGEPKEVDHHIEVSCDRTLAFEWKNLYLSCKKCNAKVNHTDIPIDTVLDPCKDSDTTIKAHIDFEDEVIVAKNNSQKGLKTIQKYRLDTEHHDYHRMKKLKEFNTTLRKMLSTKGYKNLTNQELAILKRFAQENQPYSLMFSICLEKYGLL